MEIARRYYVVNDSQIYIRYIQRVFADVDVAVVNDSQIYIRYIGLLSAVDDAVVVNDSQIYIRYIVYSMETFSIML